MTSYTYTLHGLCTTFDLLFDHYKATPDPLAAAPRLSKFLLKNAVSLAKKDKLSNLHYWARTCDNQTLEKKLDIMEHWIADEDRQTSIRLGNECNLLVATAYSFDQKWLTPMGGPARY